MQGQTNYFFAYSIFRGIEIVVACKKIVGLPSKPHRSYPDEVSRRDILPNRDHSPQWELRTMLTRPIHSTNKITTSNGHGASLPLWLESGEGVGVERNAALSCARGRKRGGEIEVNALLNRSTPYEGRGSVQREWGILLNESQSKKHGMSTKQAIRDDRSTLLKEEVIVQIPITSLALNKYNAIYQPT